MFKLPDVLISKGKFQFTCSSYSIFRNFGFNLGSYSFDGYSEYTFHLGFWFFSFNLYYFPNGRRN